MGRLRLHANVARFQRLPLNKAKNDKGANDVYKYSVEVPSNSKGFPVGQPSYIGVVKHKMEYKQVVEENTKPSLVLDESCLLQYDYSLALKGEVSDFGLLTNLKMVLIKEGFDNFNLKYLGGIWVLIEFCTKEALENFKSHVGVELLFEEDKDNMSLYSRRICIKTKLEQNIFETFKITINGKDFWIHAKEFDGDKNEDDLQAHSEDGSDIDAVPETNFSQSHEASKQGNETRIEEGEIHSDDPFNLYDLLQKKPCSKNKEEENSNATLKYPPGFTTVDDSRNKDDQAVFLNVEEQAPKQKINAQGNVTKVNSNKGVSQSKEEDKESHCSCHFRRTVGPQIGGSILQLLDDLVKVGQTMGYKMDGCVSNIEEIIKIRGENESYQ
ncbi:hypothetical protein Tco_0431273 [Tanacetum coccineum]